MLPPELIRNLRLKERTETSIMLKLKMPRKTSKMPTKHTMRPTISSLERLSKKRSQHQSQRPYQQRLILKMILLQTNLRKVQRKKKIKRLRQTPPQ